MKALKYIGMAGGAVIAFGIFPFIWIFFELLIADREYYTGRFLLTASVEVGGETKTGQSVYEVSYNARRRGSGSGASPIKGARGTMPMIDLGKHGLLLFSFRQSGEYIPGSLIATNPPKCRSLLPSSLPTAVMVETKDGYDFRDYLDEMIEAKGKYSIGNKSLSLHLFRNKKLQKNLDFCNLAVYTKNVIKPLNITIEHTDLPMDKDNPHKELFAKGSYEARFAKGTWRSKFYH